MHFEDCGNFHVTIKRLKTSSNSYSDPVLIHWWGWISHEGVGVVIQNSIKAAFCISLSRTRNGVIYKTVLMEQFSCKNATPFMIFVCFKNGYL